MICGIGTDVLDIKRLRKTCDRWGERFLSRSFTQQERMFCESFSDPVPHYATRFAAKEAVAKALGTGFNKGVRFKDIEINRNQAGQPLVELLNHTAAIARQKGISSIHLSLSHADEVCVAMVIATS